jgi:hypothetical protein
VLKGAFESWAQRGRFRDYLKRAVWNFARDHHRSRARRPVPVEGVNAAAADGPAADVWLGLYRAVLLRGAVRALRAHQAARPGNNFATLIDALGEHGGEAEKMGDVELARRLSAASGKPITPAYARRRRGRGGNWPSCSLPRFARRWRRRPPAK